MRSDAVLDYALFQLSPKRSRCELLVSSNGEMEKLASGPIQSFVSHLGILEAQAARGVQSSVKLEVEKSKHAETWFTKGTFERFVQFVSNSESLERVNKFDSEMAQLEAARNIYSQGNVDCRSSASDNKGAIAAADATKKELLRAIDLRLDAVKKDLITAIGHASAIGFNPDTVSELQQFADRFDAHHLDEACAKFISLWQRSPNLFDLQNLNHKAQTVQLSCISNVSTEEPTDEQADVDYENRCQSSFEKTDTNRRQNPTDQSDIRTQLHPNSTDKIEVDKRDETLNESSTVHSNQPTRRLSVQDRINLFENKQKENSNSGSKPLPVGKTTELRRLSSDVSSVPAVPEKSVLRRWSIVSDMSIDLTSDKKSDGSTDSPSCMLSSTPHARGDPTLKESVENVNKVKKGPGNDVSCIEIEPKSDFGNAGDQVASPHRVKIMDSGVQVTSEAQPRDSIDLNSPAAQYLIGSVTDRSGNVKIDSKSSKRVEDIESEVQNPTQSSVKYPHRHSRSHSAHIEGGIEFKSKDLCKGTDEELASQTQWRSFSGRVGKKELVPLDKQQQRTKLEKPTSAGSGKREKSFSGRHNVDDGNGRTAGPINAVLEDQDNNNRISADQVQRTRQSKGNQVVDDELKTKANELEKLFAVHKLRGPGDQSSSRRGKPGKTQLEQAEWSHSKGAPASETSSSSMICSGEVTGDIAKLDTPLTGRMVADKDNEDVLQRNFPDLSFSDESRGKFYEKYMEKRNAKLREEGSSKRAEKETKLKSMQEALERSRDELKAKFSSPSGKKDPLSSARLRTEKFRSLKSRSSTKKFQHPISSFQGEEDEHAENSDQKYHGKDKLSNGPSIDNTASRSSQVRGIQPNRNASTVTPRAITSVPRPSAKASNTNSGRRRGQSDRPLAQSVPNFSDLKKENTKPSLVVKTTLRTQVRNTARSKNANKEMPPVKQGKLQRPQSLRKSSSGNKELTELSTLYSDDMLAPGKTEKEKNRRKITDVDPVTGFVPEFRAVDGFNDLENEECDEFEYEAEYLENTSKEEEVEAELGTLEVEDGDNEDDGNLRLSKEHNFDNSGTENGSSLMSVSQVDPGSVVDLPTTAPSTFHTVASLMDSPGESPLSWNSNTHHPFSYPHEHSDVDASMDSPVGSPASWNSRMRKKWGTALNPVMAANPSQLQTRKDVTKGFKRLLKFGRKGRAAESLMDWISVTTSEGDDDAEDRRDIANRSTEDLRKSRMGFSQGSEYGFHESEFNEQDSSIPAPAASFKLKEDQISGSSIKTPRSFFSLSTFRSKGNDPKPR